MSKGVWERFEGPIRGLRLPLNAWNALGAEGITTIDQLRARIHRIHRLPGIGVKTAQLIREELARVTPPEERSANNG